MGSDTALEGLVMNLFGNTYKGRRVLVTGHTGFKGSWLALWLTELGADVVGIALPPPISPNHWELLNLDIRDHKLDIRNADLLKKIIRTARPEIVFHLAAQSLVRRSYRDPLETWSCNVMGTANLIEACREVPGLCALLVVTSDKCYRNNEWPWGYRETDALGGHDAYSASKAATELVVASYRSAFFGSHGAPLLATARAGNVIGGGDWSEDRLIPDLVRAVAASRSLEIRSPQATRPWQHVLESLSGYLLLGQQLLAGCEHAAQAWNFGPDAEGNRSVAEVLTCLVNHWPELAWHVTPLPQQHEARLLYLDSSKARTEMDWTPVWNLDQALSNTAAWYHAYYINAHVLSYQQLRAYIDTAVARDAVWSK